MFILPLLIKIGQWLVWHIKPSDIPKLYIKGHHTARSVAYPDRIEVWEAKGKGYIRTYIAHPNNYKEVELFLKLQGWEIVDEAKNMLTNEMYKRFCSIKLKKYDYNALVSHLIYVVILLLGFALSFGKYRKGIWVNLTQTKTWKIYCNEADGYVFGLKNAYRLMPMETFHLIKQR